MSTPVDDLSPSPEAEKALRAISKLSEADRLWLFERIESEQTIQAADLSPEWRAEIAKRVQSISDGAAELHDLADVEDEARRLLDE